MRHHPRSAVRLRFGLREGRTALLESYAEVPVIVQRPLWGPMRQAVVTLLTPAGALFDYDDVAIEVVCGAGTDVTLTTAAATKLNRCDTGEITVRMRVMVEHRATFRYLPHELIPFPGTRYTQSIDVDIASDALVALLEVIGPGPSTSRFAYERLQFGTRVWSQGELSARERFVLTPSSSRQLGGSSHYGSLLMPGARAAEAIPESSALPCGGAVLKVLGSSAQEVRARLLAALPDAAWLLPLLPP